MKTQPNFVLECSQAQFDAAVKENKGRVPSNMERGSKMDVGKAAELCRRMTGSDIMPAMLYKGRVIPAGRIGSRHLSFT